MTRDELKQLAIDALEDRVFTSIHLERDGNIEMLRQVFLPLALGALREMTEDRVDKINLIYEYISKAGPHSINGYPMFFTMNILFEDDAKIFWEYLKSYDEMKKQFMGD